MNPIYRDAAQIAQDGWMMGVTTVVFLTVFLVFSVWALSRGTKEQFERAAQMPLEDDTGL